MYELKILNSREIKRVMELIESQWGAKLKLDYVFLKNQKNRIFMINRSIGKIELSKLRINSIGMYLCEIDEKGIRLSIEGSQIVGPNASKNIAEVDEKQVRQWLRGEDLEISGNYSGFVLLRHKNDFLGAGRYREGKILNYVSKSRRIEAI